MEPTVFHTIDKTKRKIKLSKERWKHITEEHPEISNYEDIAGVLKAPDKIITSDRDDSVVWYFLYNKKRKEYLKVSVKYLNGTGFVITAHYTSRLK